MSNQGTNCGSFHQPKSSTTLYHTQKFDMALQADAKLPKEALLTEALNRILEDQPPQEAYGPEVRGLFSGPTSLAYLFLNVSAERPELLINSYNAMYWSKAYLSGERTSLTFEPDKRCGVSSEVLAYLALRAVVYKDNTLVEAFHEKVIEVLSTPTEPEWIYGRAGTLYLTRLICHWFPESSTILSESIAKLRASLVKEGPNWMFYGLQDIGAAHGSIGIITQIILSSPLPEERQVLQTWLIRLLNLQMSNGNWPYSENNDKGHVQFCHGAPGFVQGLLSIRNSFPDLHNEIDQAIKKANDLIEQSLILQKEPNLCHGSFGNGL